MGKLPLIKTLVEMGMHLRRRIQLHDFTEQRLSIGQRDTPNGCSHLGQAGSVHGEAIEAHGHQQQRPCRVPGQLATQRNGFVQTPGILGQLDQRAQQRWVQGIVEAGYPRIVAVYRQQVLGEIVTAHREEVHPFG